MQGGKLLIMTSKLDEYGMQINRHGLWHGKTNESYLYSM